MELDIPESFSYNLKRLDDIPHMCVSALEQLCNTDRTQTIEFVPPNSQCVTKVLQCSEEIASILCTVVRHAMKKRETKWAVHLHLAYPLQGNYKITVLMLTYLQSMVHPEGALNTILNSLNCIRKTANDLITPLKIGWTESTTQKYSKALQWLPNEKVYYLYTHSSSFMKEKSDILRDYFSWFGHFPNSLHVSSAEGIIMLLVRKNYLQKVSNLALDLKLNLHKTIPKQNLYMNPDSD